MSYRSIQQEVDQLFDRADHPNIAHKDDGDYKLMTKIVKLPISTSESIEIIRDVLEAIIYVSSHLIIYKPCQVFKQHVIKKHGKWGLCNIICYRDPNESQEFDPEHYYPIDYYEHPDEDSELSWSLGRMWYQLLTDSRIPPIKALTDKQILVIIDTSGIKDLRITNLLKQILIIDKTKRIDLVTLVKHGLFEYEEKSKIYLHSVIPNLSEVQLMSKLNQRTGIESKIRNMNEKPYNPFEEELFKRDFKEAIAIADLFQKVKEFVFNHFEVPDNSNEIHFSCYLIDLTSYIRLQSFKIKQEENQYLIVLLYDKLDYTKYLEKLLELEGKLERKRKQKRFETFRAQFPRLLDPPSTLSKQDQQSILYPHFKKYMMSYAKCFKEQKKLDKETNDYKNYVSLIEFMLVRSAMYVFGNARKYVFGDFISQDEFQLDDILRNIASCTNVTKLKRIEEKIIELYFSKNNYD